MEAVLFDMDGTLVPMERDRFSKAYFKAITTAAAPHGYEPKKLVEKIWRGTEAMVKNDGSETNEYVFWKSLSEAYGDKMFEDRQIFDDFYDRDFSALRKECGFEARAAETVRRLKKDGVKLVLASNPIFPLQAQETRLRWAGIDPKLFDHITSYENSHYCKPNVKYYEEILDAISVKPIDCLMVGNDATEDIAASEAGMSVFILTHCLINDNNFDLSQCPHGTYDDLSAYLSVVGL